MNVARILIDAVVWLTPVAVGATLVISDRGKLVLAGCLFLCLALITGIGVARFYPRLSEATEAGRRHA